MQATDPDSKPIVKHAPDETALQMQLHNTLSFPLAIRRLQDFVHILSVAFEAEEDNLGYLRFMRLAKVL